MVTRRSNDPRVRLLFAACFFLVLLGSGQGWAERSSDSGAVPSFRVPLGDRHATSVGSSNGGRLLNGVKLPKAGPGYRRIHAKRYYGTDETIALLAHIGARLAQNYPGTQPLLVGAISKLGGGRAGGHRSHQNGVDVDWAYLEAGNPKRRYYRAKVRSQELDYEKNWFLFETAILTGRVRYIFVDKSMLGRLRQAALDAGWSTDSLRPVFGDASFKGGRRLIRHWPGHTYHAHVRFKCSPGAGRCRES